MSNTASDPAFPHTPSRQMRMDGSYPGASVRGGLSKRELFAAMAMQGQLSFSPRDSAFEKAHQPEDVARVSVSMADALICALDGA